MSLEGDRPARLTYEGGILVAGWTPDGRVIASTPNRFLGAIADVKLSLRRGLSLLAHVLARAAFFMEASHQHPALFGSQRLETLVGIQHALAIGFRHRPIRFLAMRCITSLFGRHLRPARHALLDLRALFGRQLHPALGMRGHALLATRRELIPLRLQWREHRALGRVELAPWQGSGLDVIGTRRAVMCVHG